MHLDIGARVCLLEIYVSSASISEKLAATEKSLFLYPCPIQRVWTQHVVCINLLYRGGPFSVFTAAHLFRRKLSNTTIAWFTCTIIFKGREIQHTDLAVELLNKMSLYLLLFVSLCRLHLVKTYSFFQESNDFQNGLVITYENLSEEAALEARHGIYRSFFQQFNPSFSASRLCSLRTSRLQNSSNTLYVRKWCIRFFQTVFWTGLWGAREGVLCLVIL